MNSALYRRYTPQLARWKPLISHCQHEKFLSGWRFPLPPPSNQWVLPGWRHYVKMDNDESIYHKRWADFGLKEKSPPLSLPHCYILPICDLQYILILWWRAVIDFLTVATFVLNLSRPLLFQLMIFYILSNYFSGLRDREWFFFFFCTEKKWEWRENRQCCIGSNYKRGAFCFSHAADPPRWEKTQYYTDILMHDKHTN